MNSLKYSSRMRYGLIALYIVICMIFGHAHTPLFLYSWRLYDTWTPQNHAYNDIVFHVDGSDEDHYAVKSASYLMSHGVDTFRLANVLLRVFNYADFNSTEVFDNFKKNCDCHNPELVEINGAVSDHVIYNKEIKFKVLREL